MVYEKEVHDFLERDDNSRCMPGKADVKKSAENMKRQTRILTDYLANLHMKFIAECPTIKLSRATFCRMRPIHILTTSFISRSTCLCTKHQNMALLLKALRKQDKEVPANPETFAMEGIAEEMLRNKLSDHVVFSQWKKIQIIEKEKKKFVTRIIESEKEKEEFIEYFINQAEEFRGHVERVRKQYEEIKKLKENLPPNHLLVQMDFAENYSCKSVEEIQSAYWNQTGVTLHPAVAYFKDDKGDTQHKSYVVVSDEMSHSSSTVHAILEKLIPEMKTLISSIEFIHYWTDGPTSQYRNRQIFFTIANHMEMFGMRARWNYFEVGHGKGPCDGLGGTTKRMADEAVRCQKTVIQDANDFYKWACTSNMKGILFLFVSSEECNRMEELLKSREVKPVKGTFKLHAVADAGKSAVFVRDTSCYCNVCLEGNVCEGWRKEILQKSTVQDVDESNSNHTTALKGNYVAARYLEKCYIGKVTDEDDNEFEISFMETKKEKLQWPKKKDILWIPSKDVLFVVAEPMPIGRSGRMFELQQQDKEKFGVFLS